MADRCQSCGRAPVEIVEALDDPGEPYKVCRGCYHRLLTHSLRPIEWYNLSSIHGRLNDLLSREYYDEGDGKALKPAERVVDAAMFPCPTLEEAAKSPERLLTYILTRNHIHEEGQVESWYIQEDLIASMRGHSPDALISAFAGRLNVTGNIEIARTIFHLIGLTLETAGATLVRDNWERFASTHALSGIAFAASRCLPPEEAYRKVTETLSGMDTTRCRVEKHNLRWFETQRNLDWIEKNACSPVDSSWGLLAASSRFDWARAKKWLSLGRPLSLIALDALVWCLCSRRKPPLPDPPSSREFVAVLEGYLQKDNVPRVRECVHNLLNEVRP
jgi:hypothetical protein